MIHIKIPFKTPSINHLYWNKGHYRILTSEAKKLRVQIEAICSEVKHSELYKDKPLAVSIFVNENWLQKNGKIKRADVANREKFLIDSVFKAIDLDDRYIMELFIKKEQSDEEYTVIQIDSIAVSDRIIGIPP